MLRSPEQIVTVARTPRPWLVSARAAAGGLFLVVLGWALMQAGLFQRDLLNEGGWTLAWRFIRAAWRPDLSPTVLQLAVQSTLITLAYAVCGTALSLVIGTVTGLFSSEVWWQAVLPRKRDQIKVASAVTPWLGARALLAVPRAIHEIIWGLFFVNIIGLDPLTAILAIAIPFGAMTAKVFAEILDETPREPLRALEGSGARPLQGLMYGLLPQALPDLLSYAFYRFECAIRSATLLGIIGAGGLGYQILLSLQSLRYEEMWTFLFALILLSGGTDVWSGLVRRRLTQASGSTRALNGPNCTGSAEKRTQGSWSQHASFPKASLCATALLTLWSFWYVDANPGKLFQPRTMHLLTDIAAASFPPRLDPQLLADLFRLSAQTLSMSILAMAFAGIGGICFAYAAARSLLHPGGLFGSDTPRHVRLIDVGIVGVSRGVLLVTRAIAEPIWAFIFLLILFPGVLPGALGLGMYNLGVLGRLMIEVTENMDRRPLRALQAHGASPVHVFIYGVLPLTLPRNLAYVLYRWEVCTRATVVVGLVGASGLGRRLADQLASFDYRGMMATLLFFVGLTFLVDLSSTALRRLLR